MSPEKGHISNEECAVTGQVVALRRTVCLKPGASDGCQAKLRSQWGSCWAVNFPVDLGDC